MLGRVEAEEEDTQLSQQQHRTTGAGKWGLVGMKLGYSQLPIAQ